MKPVKTAICIALLLNVVCPAQILLKLSGDSLSAYSYNGGDEFNNGTLDDKMWTNGLGWTRVLMSQDLAFSTAKVNFENDVLDLIAAKEDSVYILNQWEIDSAYLKKQKLQLPGNAFKTEYSVGCIITRKKLHYGLYEARFKVEKGRGVWPAFWFYGGNKNEEIDIFELKGERNNEIHVDTHCPYGCDHGYKNKIGLNTNWGGWMPVSNYLHDGFNIMALEWKKNELIWYINGYPLAYFKGEFPNPMNLYLNTSVAKDGGAFKPGPDKDTPWPNHYYVDYFRTWQAIEPGGKVILSANDNLKTSGKFPADYDTKPERKRGLMYKKKKLNAINGMISLTLSTKNKLGITVLGKLAGKNATISIKTASSEQKITQFDKETQLDLDPSVKEIELIIVSDDKQFSRKITIQ